MTSLAAKFKPYSAMKDSSVEWFGKVPEHWEVLPNRALFDEIKEHDCPDEEMLSVTIRQGVVKQSSLLRDTSKKDSSNLDRSNYKLVHPGDIAYNKMRAWQGAVGVSSYRGIVSPAYVVQRPRKVADPRFLHHLLRTPGFAKEAERWSYGITSDMWSLRPEHFKLICMCLPPLPEQDAIVRFIEYVDRRIRRYIRAKQKLIKLLEEQKQAIIHRAVTRGLDPDVPLKDSGVEWLGEVPEHWEVMLLSRGLTGIGQGWSPVAAEGDLSPDQWAVLTLSSVRRGRFKSDAIKPIAESAKVPDGIEVRDGDLLLTRSNTRDLVGDTCVVSGVRPRTVICDLIYRLAPDLRRFDSSFLMYLLLSRVGRRQIEQDARGSSGTMPKISQRHIRSWRVLAPPLNEQHRISQFIAVKLKRIDAAIFQANSEIALLNEYRTRLIADVVTGKLDVREASASLPDETEESGTTDDLDEMIEAELDQTGDPDDQDHHGQEHDDE
ncbi:hypothetical protein JW848_11030 [Candidatus Bipolaricaulota bacterium]|nr:hypothetical protein [Candidatus Bipolaricaulota bacterium]